MKIITVSSLKGGVGKTSTVIYLSQALKKLNYKVLVVDVDPNNNLTDYFLRDIDPGSIDKENIYQAITKKCTYADVIYKTDFGIDIIPCTLSLHKIGLEMSGNPASLLSFKSKIKTLDYDFVLMDSPPALCYELRFSLYAADILITPLAPVRWIKQGIDLLSEELQGIADTLGRVPVSVALPYMVSKTDLIKMEFLQDITQLRTAIPKRAEIKNKGERSRALSEKGKAMQDFISLSNEIILLCGGVK